MPESGCELRLKLLTVISHPLCYFFVCFHVGANAESADASPTWSLHADTRHLRGLSGHYPAMQYEKNRGIYEELGVYN